MANTTRTQIPDEVNNFYDKTLLDRAVANFVHTMFGQVRDIPKKSGTETIKFRRYGNLSAATSPLSEGVTPDGSQLSVTDITATVKQYGDFVTITDVVDYSSKDMVLMEAAEILGDQAGDTLDQLARDVLVAGTSVYYSGSGNSARGDVASGDTIAAADVKSAVTGLKNNKAKKVTSMVDPTTGYNTTPLNRAYIGIIHPDISETLRGLTGFVPVQEYPSNRNALPHEIGYLEEVRFIESTNAKVFTDAGTGSIDVYATLIMGKNAYGVTRISGEAMKNIVKPLGSGGSADPLDQRATSGWKATFVTKILNDDYMTRIESAAS